MTRFILLVFIFLVKTTFSQECETGKDSANADFNRKIYRLYGFDAAMSGPSQTYSRLLATYGITFNSKSYATEFLLCYNEQMTAHIKQLHGADFFSQIGQKADDLDQSGLGDRPAQWPDAIPSLRKFISCHIDYDKIDFATFGIGIVVVSFRVTTTGTLEDFREERAFIHPAYAQEMIRILQLSGKWIPATSNGKLVEERVHIPVEFNIVNRIIDCE